MRTRIRPVRGSGASLTPFMNGSVSVSYLRKNESLVHLERTLTCRTQDFVAPISKRAAKFLPRSDVVWCHGADEANLEGCTASVLTLREVDFCEMCAKSLGLLNVESAVQRDVCEEGLQA